MDYSEWATSIVPVVKADKSIRICDDFKVTVNPVLQIDQYSLPRSEDIFASLAGGQEFSKIDLDKTNQQMLVTHESRKFLTINTSKGLHQYGL